MTASEIWHNCLYTAIAVFTCLCLGTVAWVLKDYRVENVEKHVNSIVDNATSQGNRVINNAALQANGVVTNATLQVRGAGNDLIYQFEDGVVSLLSLVDKFKIFGCRPIRIDGLDDAQKRFLEGNIQINNQLNAAQRELMVHILQQQGALPLNINNNQESIQSHNQSQTALTNNMNNSLNSAMPGGLPGITVPTVNASTYDDQSGENHQNNNGEAQVNNGGFLGKIRNGWRNVRNVCGDIRDVVTGNTIGEIELDFNDMGF